MKRVLIRLTRALPHLCIVLSLMTLVFFCIDRVNPIMAFMTSEMSKWLFAFLAVLSVFDALLLISLQWHADDKRAARLARAAAKEAEQAKTASAENDGAPDMAENDTPATRESDDAPDMAESGDAPASNDTEEPASEPKA